MRVVGGWFYLSVGVAEDDGDEATLESVKQGVDVVIDFDPLAAFVRRPVDCHDEVESEERNQHQCRPHRFPAFNHDPSFPLQSMPFLTSNSTTTTTTTTAVGTTTTGPAGGGNNNANSPVQNGGFPGRFYYNIDDCGHLNRRFGVRISRP